jgi:zinc finger protein
MDKLENQPCPMCNKKTLTLLEEVTEVPYFGKCYLFSMKCSSCHYYISDVEAEEQKEPSRYTIETSSEKDMQIRIVKSSAATVKIPGLKVTITPGPASIGYISNIEGVLERVKKILEEQRDFAEEGSVKKTAKNLLKKLWKATLGDIPLKIIIEDPSGNSAIISPKAKIERLKK